MENHKRYLILFISGVFLLKILSCSIVPESAKEDMSRCPEISDSKEISANEINTFLELWKEYIAEGYEAKVSQKGE